MLESTFLNQTYYNIQCVNYIISSYNNLKVLKRIYPRKNQINDLLNVRNNYHIAKRIQLLAVISFKQDSKFQKI